MVSGMPGNLTSDVMGALGLRRWAIAVLAGRTAPEPGPLSQKSWDLFLEAERCAVPLMRRIADHNLDETLSHEFKVRLEQRARAELLRIGSARRQLAVAAEVADELGCRVVALKGGVGAINLDQAVDLVDVDVLVEPQHARDFVMALDRRGFRAGGSSVAHLAARWSDEPLPIEVHTTWAPFGRPLPYDFWHRIQQSEEFDGIHLLSPPDHLWHILTHVVVSHPNRQGHLRELLLIGSAIDRNGQDMTVVHNRMSEVGDRETMKAVIQAANELRDGCLHSDALIEVPALGYSVWGIIGSSPVTSAVAGQAYMWSLGFLMGPGLRRLLWSQIWYTTQDPSHVPWLGQMELRFPIVGRVVRVSMRLMRFALAVSLAIPVAGITALTTRRALNKT